MSRWISLLLILCLAVPALSVCAESTRKIVTEFDDFILRTDWAMQLRNKKADNQPLFLFYPFVTGNVAMTAINATWSRDGQFITPEEFSLMYRDAEALIRAQYEASGRVLESYETKDAVEKEFWGRKSLVCDAVLTVKTNDTAILLNQRAIRVTGDFGAYTFSIAAWSPELLDEATDYLLVALEWK